MDNKTKHTNKHSDTAVDKDINSNECWKEECKSPNDDFCSVWICVLFYGLVYYGQKNVDKPTAQKNQTSKESEKEDDCGCQGCTSCGGISSE